MKRFIETTMWTQNKWFRTLPTKYKMLWMYLFCNSDAVGVWEEDLEVASFFLQEKFDHDETINLFAEKIFVFRAGKKWWIRDFVSFQYGVLSTDCKPHVTYINLLKKHTLWIEYTKGMYTLQEKETDKEMDMDMEKDKEKGVEKKNKARAESFDEVWEYLTDYDVEQEPPYGSSRIKALARTFWDDMQKSGWCYGEKKNIKLKDWAAHARKYYSNEPKFNSANQNGKPYQRYNPDGTLNPDYDSGKMAGVPRDMRAAFDDPLNRRGGRPIREGIEEGDGSPKLLR